MKATSVATRIRSGEKLINGWCSIPSPVIAETLARQGFDTLTVDLQHGLNG